MLTVLRKESNIEGATAAFSLARGLIAGAIAAALVAGEVVVIGDCLVFSGRFEEALQEN